MYADDARRELRVALTNNFDLWANGDFGKRRRIASIIYRAIGMNSYETLMHCENPEIYDTIKLLTGENGYSVFKMMEARHVID